MEGGAAVALASGDNDISNNDARALIDRVKRKGRRGSISAECSSLPSVDQQQHQDHIVESNDNGRDAASTIGAGVINQGDIDTISTATSNNFLFHQLNEQERIQVFTMMKKRISSKGDIIIKEGDAGDFFYILSNGSCDVFIKQEKVFTYHSGSAFGELALMYNQPRAATVIVSSDEATLWMLDGAAFRQRLLSNQLKRKTMYESFLSRIPLMKALSPSELSKTADVLDQLIFEPGTVIFTEGDNSFDSMKFYFVIDGNAVVYEKNVKLATLSPGDFFGERALIERSPRSASVVAETRCECGALDVAAFERLLGPCKDIMARRFEEYQTASTVAPQPMRIPNTTASTVIKTSSVGSSVSSISSGSEKISLSRESSSKSINNKPIVVAKRGVFTIGNNIYQTAVRKLKGKTFSTVQEYLNFLSSASTSVSSNGTASNTTAEKSGASSKKRTQVQRRPTFCVGLDVFQTSVPDLIGKSFDSVEEFSKYIGETASKRIEGDKAEKSKEEKKIERARSRGRRGSISAEPTPTVGMVKYESEEKSPIIKTVHAKTADQLSRIQRAVSNNFLFSSLSDDERKEVMDAMFEKIAKSGETVIEQNAEGDYFYIIDSGSCNIYQDGQLVATKTPGDSFGELALMYNCPRNATVVAASDCVLWALDRMTFRSIIWMRQSSKRKIYEGSLSRVQIFKETLSKEEICRIADVLEEIVFQPEAVVFKEGDDNYESMQFYIILEGEAEVVSRTSGNLEILGRESIFGERALIERKPRSATIIAHSRLVCAALDIAAFERLLGASIDRMKGNFDYYDESRSKMKEQKPRACKYSFTIAGNQFPTNVLILKGKKFADLVEYNNFINPSSGIFGGAHHQPGSSSQPSRNSQRRSSIQSPRAKFKVGDDEFITSVARLKNKNFPDIETYIEYLQNR